MAKWARIENGVVAETTDVNPSGRFHPSLVWVSCPDNIEQRDTYQNNQFTKFVEPVIPTPAELQAALTGDVDPAVLAAAEQFIQGGV